MCPMCIAAATISTAGLAVLALIGGRPTENKETK